MLPVDKIENLFSFVVAAAKRMRQLQSGQRPLIETHSRKPIKIATEELMNGAVKYELPQPIIQPPEKDKKKKSGK